MKKSVTLLRGLGRFARASGGMAAVEFAILLPMMVFLLFGSVDLIATMAANRRAQNTAASLADVVARDTEISNDEVSSLWSAMNVLMYPNDGGTMQVRISCVRIADVSTARVVWSEGHGGYAARTANSTMSLPAGMMQVGSSVIVAETIYTYRSPLGFLSNGAFTLTHNAYRRSRLIDPIPRVA